MGYLVPTTRFTRGRLPHWEVERGRYFVTVRCADSLPAKVVAQLAEIHRSLSSVEPASPDFARWQRQYFLTMEKHLDAGVGNCPLRDPRAAQALVDTFSRAESRGISIPHFTVMPNHWHVLITPCANANVDLHAAVSHLKGSSARAINLALGRTGTLWQREWFDRWVRDDTEWDRFVSYISRNPVKAELVRNPGDHPWTR